MQAPNRPEKKKREGKKATTKQEMKGKARREKIQAWLRSKEAPTAPRKGLE